ncbi:MAG: hypothetical protein IPM17_15640 [Verrucomicrobia bacterium]|nr:hypothetical protein [Verrucomicrobiota bacterium]
MKLSRPLIKLAVAALTAGVFAGCGSSGDGSNVSGGMYYGTGFADPWYHGGYYNDVDVIVTPPGGGARPEHPVARPLPAPAPAPRPMPSMPAAPRPMPRGR